MSAKEWPWEFYAPWPKWWSMNHSDIKALTFQTCTQNNRLLGSLIQHGHQEEEVIGSLICS